MYILTPENVSLDTIQIPERTKTDIRYGVYDHKEHEDYMFESIYWLDEYPRAATELKIGEYIIQVPYNWAILLGDEDGEELELLHITKFGGRDFKAFVMNPLTGYIPKFWEIEIYNVYNEVKWTVPPFNQHQMLCVPLCGGDNPPCVYFAEYKNKISDTLDVRNMF